MTRLRQLALGLGSVLLTCGVAQGQAKLGLYVVDSNDQRVGYPLSTMGVTTFIEGSPIAVNSGRDGFAASQDFTVYFSAADCSGTAYLRQETIPGFRPTFTLAYFTSDGFLHYCLAESVEVLVSQASKLVHSDGTIDPCQDGSDSFFAAPALTVATPFTPPFRVVEALPVSPAPGAATFNDVPTDHPFFQYIEALSASEVTGGCNAAPPLYCPDNFVTRGQMAVFLAKALGL